LALYAIDQDASGSWRIQAIPVDPHSFQSRKKLPDVWCGLRDNILSEKTGIADCIFVHASGFIGGHQNKEGAIYMAKKVRKVFMFFSSFCLMSFNLELAGAGNINR
jgi:uncharacterized UPF0160 family protein